MRNKCKRKVQKYGVTFKSIPLAIRTDEHVELILTDWMIWRTSNTAPSYPCNTNISFSVDSLVPCRWQKIDIFWGTTDFATHFQLIGFPEEGRALRSRLLRETRLRVLKLPLVIYTVVALYLKRKFTRLLTLSKNLAKSHLKTREEIGRVRTVESPTLTWVPSSGSGPNCRPSPCHKTVSSGCCR